jgi:hypothetical protein
MPSFRSAAGVLAVFLLAPEISMATSSPAGLEIEQDPEHDKTVWRVRRIGWALVCFLWLAGLAGLFGSGLLSQTAVSGPGLRLDYERFVRYTAPQKLILHLDPSLTAQSKVRLWVDRRYLESQKIESIVPEPESVEAGSDRMVFTVSVAEVGKPTAVTLYLRTQRTGSFEGRIGVARESLLRFHQLVYP